jgi:hypothetical protein
VDVQVDQFSQRQKMAAFYKKQNAASLWHFAFQNAHHS